MPRPIVRGDIVSLETEKTEIQDNTVEGAHPTTDLVREIESALDAGDTVRVKDLCSDLHSAEMGALLELLDSEDRVKLTDIFRKEFDPEVLTELEGPAFEDVVGVLKPNELADAITELDTDDALYVLEEIEDEEEQQRLLKKIPAADRVAIEEGLGYPEDSAGRLMQRELVAVPPHWTVGKTIDFMRREKNLPSDFYEIFVVDPKHVPIGTVPLSRLMRTQRPVEIAKIMETDQTLIPAIQDQEQTAYTFRQYNLVSAAVVDEGGRLVGVITVDDIMDVIDEEAEEDILALAGVSEGDVNVSVRNITKTRFVWLVVNLFTAMLASYVISFFEGSIEKLVALAVLMPIVASMGGNAGNQTMTVAVRAIAMHELTSANVWRVLNREVLGSLLNGVLLAILVAGVSVVWFKSLDLGLVIGAAMIINIGVAGFSGVVIPMALEKLDIDPAVASSVFVTTITDVVGFLAFLGLAALYLL